MNATRAKRGFTLVDLLAVIVIIAVFVGCIPSALNFSREAERRATCINNQHMIGIAFQNHASTFFNAYPRSASLTIAPDGNKATVYGWSFLVKLMPFMQHDALYKSLPVDGDPEDTTKPAIATAMKTQLAELLCPSAPHSSAPQTAGITSYKAMGASTRDSLVIAANPKAKPPYGYMQMHPDGAMYPSTANLSAGLFMDGLSHTIFTIETIDEAASRWTVGKEATLVGLPQKSSPTGTSPQAPYNFFAPPGFDNTFGENSGVAKAGLRTFLSYDFSPTGADAGKYEDPGFSQTPPTYGPSSGHPAVVICGMGDASVQALSKQIDAAALFFLITKNGDDPFPFSASYSRR